MEELRTARLRLRDWRDGDVDAYAAIVADPEVMRFMGSGPLDRAAAAFQIGRFRALFRGWGTPHWAAEDRATGELVGRIGLFHHPDWPLDPENVEVGWMLARRRWGEGLATEGGAGARREAWAARPGPRVVSV
jgi:RimJ/RimL family protein N-acetyltransferase